MSSRLTPLSALEALLRRHRIAEYDKKDGEKNTKPLPPVERCLLAPLPKPKRPTGIGLEIEMAPLDCWYFVGGFY